MPKLAPHLAVALAAAAPRGSVIRTEINGALQAALESLACREQAAQDDGRGSTNLAFLVVETQSRAVRAYIGNARPEGRAGFVDLARATRSPGSTLKPLVYAVAFDDLAAHPLTQIEDRPTMFGDYEPRNFDRGYQGTVVLADALRYSLNVPAVALLDRVGPARFTAKLADAGVTLSFPKGVSGPSLPLVLGGVGTSLYDLVTLYAALGDGGIVRPLHLRHDRPTHERATALFGPVAAWYVRDALLDSPLPEGWGVGRGLTRRPVAFKTGTSYGFRDAWSIGVSGRYTVGIWVGRPDGSTRPGAIGRNTAAPLLLSVFDQLPPEPASRPAPPSGAIVAQNNEELPRALRHFSVNRAAGSGARAPAQPLEIAFPPNGATVALPDLGTDLALRAEGGHGALFWVVDGAPLDRTRTESRRASWAPQGPGYSRITVIDADGKSASSLVKLVSAP
jgi:penicillin-binding protein 1C